MEQQLKHRAWYESPSVRLNRWREFRRGLDTTNTLDPTGASGSFAGYVFTEAAHTATKPTTGEFVQAGAIYTNTDGTIWMYA